MGKRIRRPAESDVARDQFVAGQTTSTAVVPASEPAPTTQYAIDADAATGTDVTQRKTNTYLIDSIGGHLEHRVRQARASTDYTAVFSVCDERQSVLVYNKLYGMSITVPVKDSVEREEMHLFSAFHPHRIRKRFDPATFVYAVPFGGLKDCGPVNSEEPTQRLGALLPLVACSATMDLIYGAKSDFGWITLMYENKGPDDPNPTGIVAFEGWLFKMVEERVRDNRTNKWYTLKKAVDHDDLVYYGSRIQMMVDHAATLAPTVAASMATAAPAVGEGDDAEMTTGS